MTEEQLRNSALDMLADDLCAGTAPTAAFRYSHPPRDGRQVLVYEVWLGRPRADCSNLRLVWLDVASAWLRDSASLNELKAMACAQALAGAA